MHIVIGEIITNGKNNLKKACRRASDICTSIIENMIT